MNYNVNQSMVRHKRDVNTCIVLYVTCTHQGG